jgi:hypothetical protein
MGDAMPVHIVCTHDEAQAIIGRHRRFWVCRA